MVGNQNGEVVTDRLRGRLFVKESDRGLGQFEYIAHGDTATLWTIPGTSDHVGFLKLQNENKAFVLQLADSDERVDIVVREVKPSGDRFEVEVRVVGT